MPVTAATAAKRYETVSAIPSSIFGIRSSENGSQIADVIRSANIPPATVSIGFAITAAARIIATVPADF